MSERDRQVQRFQIEFPAPTPSEADLVQAWELQEFLENAIRAARHNGEPQDTEALFYAKLDELKVTGL